MSPSIPFNKFAWHRQLLAVCLVAITLGSAGALAAREILVPFEGEKSTWHDGFERFDFVMDEATLAITPFKAPEGEKFGVRDPAKGQRRCLVIVPKQAAAGNPWSWQGCYWDHQPQAEVELLRRGFHLAYISANANLRPGKEWDAWYEFLTAKHGLSRKPAFIGMSRGGEYAYSWATANPTKVACIYADNPGGNKDMLMRLGALATNDVPLLHVCGSIDPLLGRFSSAIEGIYQQWGGRISVMIKDGYAHHPHSLRDPKPIADFITASVQETPPTPPDYLAGRIARTTFYSPESAYREFPSEGTYITCRGPRFVECYERYAFELPGVDGSITVTVPNSSAAGKPWVLRSEFVSRDAAIDLALLAKGFHIVTGPVSYNTDGPVLEHWNKVYEHLTGHGFSKKPVLEGTGAAAGDAYAWASANPDKVACLYAENPVMRSFMSKLPAAELIIPLAKAGVPVLHLCGSLDPALEKNTLAVEKKYRELGGSMTVILREGEGHFGLASGASKAVVEFILGKIR